MFQQTVTEIWTPDIWWILACFFGAHWREPVLPTADPAEPGTMP